ncbi:DUF350 domain-containing protein [Cryptosporangium aurantiacum]|uniref:DUF350 domain-containing protein n=1 Tax=Cryptosporangium aurantiacum TaxID=134849 RepID=A0A1M7RM74_9ACTN|nr:DUF350 domain-containing protein [Cryptosporangium aurantiacum]SHN47427.1 protein of unknown function [Cryptosporangium aurantiacum]
MATDLALDSTYWNAVGEGAGSIVAYAALGLVLLLVGYYAIDLATPGRLSVIIRDERNINATVLAACGVFSVALIIVAAIWSSGGRLVEGLISTAVFGLIGIVAQVVAAFVFNILARIDVRRLVHDPTVSPAAVLLGVTNVAIGLVTAMAVI